MTLKPRLFIPSFIHSFTIHPFSLSLTREVPQMSGSLQHRTVTLLRTPHLTGHVLTHQLPVLLLLKISQGRAIRLSEASKRSSGGPPLTPPHKVCRKRSGLVRTGELAQWVECIHKRSRLDPWHWNNPRGQSQEQHLNTTRYTHHTN